MLEKPHKNKQAKNNGTILMLNTYAKLLKASLSNTTAHAMELMQLIKKYIQNGACWDELISSNFETVSFLNAQHIEVLFVLHTAFSAGQHDCDCHVAYIFQSYVKKIVRFHN
jgi:hypothetical protein